MRQRSVPLSASPSNSGARAIIFVMLVLACTSGIASAISNGPSRCVSIPTHGDSAGSDNVEDDAWSAM